jgi:hypothetical protein
LKKKTMSNLQRNNYHQLTMNQELRKNGCWGCARASEDPLEKYICPNLEQHWKEYSKLGYE